jgi:D-sedoheptulose 7-phosphate isomerase
MIGTLLSRALTELGDLLPRLVELQAPLERLAQTMESAFGRRAKALICGNGGSAADAMHLAEELSVRFNKDRRALPAVALLDPAALTCAANDLGYERVFARQVEALGNPGDLLIGLSTSGNSASVVRAVETARSLGLTTVAFLGRDGGRLRGMCDIELLVPHADTARVQEAHKLLFHVLCAWLDTRFD